MKHSTYPVKLLLSLNHRQINQRSWTTPIAVFSLIQFFICLSLTHAQGVWTQFASGTTETLYDVNFTDGNNGFACGTNGKILKTTDGGENWNSVPSGITDGFNVIQFLNASTGYASGAHNGNLVKTTDGGNSWAATGLNIPNANDGGMWFVNADTGYCAIGDSSFANSKILRTQNGGASWDTVYSGTPWISYFFFADANNGYATCSQGVMLKTIDGGSSWTSLSMGGNYWMSGVYFFDANNGFVSGGGSTSPIWKTSDGGTSWQIVQTIPCCGGVSKIFFADADTGYALNSSQTGAASILKTVDGGISWNPESFPGDSLRGIFFPDSSIGFAVGNNGTIIRKGTPPTYSIWGTVYNKDHTATINNYKSYLISFDTVANQLAYVDSFIDTGGNGDYFFLNHPVGSYLILIRPDASVYPNTILTYYGDTAYWGYATIMNLVSDTAGIDIRVRQTPVWTGNGFCSGTIRFGLGSGKTNTGNVIPFGDPVPGVDLSLQQIPGGIIKAHTNTNDSGFYAIANIPMNTAYKLLVDIPGLPMDSTYSITINPSDSVITGLDFVVDTTPDSGGIFIGFPLSARELTPSGLQFKIYPNPNNGKFTIISQQLASDNLQKNELVKIEIYNILGEKIYRLPITDYRLPITINLSSQPKGIYFITVKTESGMWVGKVLVE